MGYQIFYDRNKGTEQEYPNHPGKGQKDRGKREYMVTAPYNEGEHYDPQPKEKTRPADEDERKLQKVNELLAHIKITAQQVYQEKEQV